MLTRQQVRAIAKTFYHDISIRESNMRDWNGIMKNDAMKDLLEELGYTVTPR